MTTLSHAPSSGGVVRRDQWWRTDVIYQVYIRSFADGDGDGLGDLPGLRSRLPYLADLGVDAIWVTPWYPSPMADGGYDVADYRDIDPRFGTLDDARALVADAHALGLRLIIDLVPNHTSNEHPWFRAAVAAAPGSRERARYHFRDGRGDDGSLPPNDWISAFGGPAWTRVPNPDGAPGQWYLHLFAPEQPDLNWADEEVLAEFEDIIRFWLDLGIDGLRVDAASAIAKDPNLPDHGFGVEALFRPRTWYGAPMWDHDDVHGIFRRWRAIADGYTPPRAFVGEITVNGPERLARYLRPDELHTAFNLDFLKTAWNAAELRAIVDSSLAAMRPVDAPATWVLSNHDETRHVTRYGRAETGIRDDAPIGGAQPTDVALGTRRARAAVLLMLALPGSAYLYQGEELGLAEVDDLPDEVRQDPIFFRTDGSQLGRDGCRVPLPWSQDGPGLGFGPSGGAAPWLPQPARWADLTAEQQAADPASTLSLYRRALRLRRELLLDAGDTLAWQDSPAGTLVLDRGPLRCVVNVSGDPLAPGGEVLLASGPLDGGLVPADTAAWVAAG